MAFGGGGGYLGMGALSGLGGHRGYLVAWEGTWRVLGGSGGAQETWGWGNRDTGHSVGTWRGRFVARGVSWWQAGDALGDTRWLGRGHGGIWLREVEGEDSVALGGQGHGANGARGALGGG